MTVASSHASGSKFPIGTTWVTITAGEAAAPFIKANTITYKFKITVKDTNAPVLVAPNVTIEATNDWGAVVKYKATATDSSGPIYFWFSVPDGSRFPIGTTSESVYAYDKAGNKSPTQTFTVTVRRRSTP